FFPAMSEEFMSRAFSIPFFERVFRFRYSRVFAIVLAAYIWGFGHSTYPNQPFYIRGLEVGSAGVLLGFLLQAFGLLPLLIWHFTVDALYTALMLFRSGNIYYVISTGIASMVFTIPLIASIVLYVRHRGFAPDDDLSNATLTVSPAPERKADQVEAPLPGGITPGRRLLVACAMAIVMAIILTVRRPQSPDDVIDFSITEEQAKSIAAAHLRGLQQPLPTKIAVAPVSGFRSWDAESPREEGGSPGGFDETAATYMVRHGLSVDALTSIMRTEVPTATYTVRFFTPMQKVEYFVEVDPRRSRVTGYHKYADERTPGARLDRDAALAIATRALPVYGSSPSDFVMKDALTFEQPNRRDWLFHFEQRRPLVAEAVRRVSIRVMGSEVTQFATTVKVPDAVYREAHQQTFMNIILLIVRLLGAIAALALVVSGFIMATRHGLPHWRRAVSVVLALSIIPIVRVMMTRELHLFSYNTSTSWDTFLVTATTNAVRDAGLQILMIAAAVAAIFAVIPYAGRVFSKESRQRFGRHATIAVLTAIAMLVAGREIVRLAAHQFPSIANVGEISVPDEVVLPLPLLNDLATSIAGAVIFAGAAAAYSASVAAWKKPWTAPVVTMATIFCVTIDSSATPRELPMTIITSAALAGLVWIIARYILNGNPLAWPLAAFTTSLIESGASMIQNHRTDLQIQGSIAFAITIATLIWAVGLPNAIGEVHHSE
ncbi:MAG TPA: CPBP family intramembrane glutamic endopeptidase, partial [Thermoanaerobaculia bacterium]